MTISTVLLDLDGVVRHFDPAHVAAVEARHGLEPGLLTATAFEPTLLTRAITGQIERADWVAEVGRLIANPTAAAEWLASADRGTVDTEMLVLVDALRSSGVVVAILTNGTSTIDEEMDALGLTSTFDAIFNTATIGFAKPDRRAFEHVCDALRVDPTAVFFTDDSASKLAGADELAMTTRVFENVATFRKQLREFGLLA